jgi:hypothetical protein
VLQNKHDGFPRIRVLITESDITETIVQGIQVLAVVGGKGERASEVEMHISL